MSSFACSSHVCRNVRLGSLVEHCSIVCCLLFWSCFTDCYIDLIFCRTIAKPSTVLQNHREPSTVLQNHREPFTVLQNHREPSTVLQNHRKAFHCVAEPSQSLPLCCRTIASLPLCCRTIASFPAEQREDSPAMEG